MNKYWVSYQADDIIEAETWEEAEEKMRNILREQERTRYFRILEVEDDEEE